MLLRLRINAKVEGAGHSMSGNLSDRTVLSFSGPQRRCCFRRSVIAFSTGLGVLFGHENGAQERSRSPAMPFVSYRARYRYPRVLEMPYTSQSSDMDQQPDRHSLMKLIFSFIGDVSFHGMFSPLYMHRENVVQSVNNVLRIV